MLLPHRQASGRTTPHADGAARGSRPARTCVAGGDDHACPCGREESWPPPGGMVRLRHSSLGKGIGVEDSASLSQSAYCLVSSCLPPGVGVLVRSRPSVDGVSCRAMAQLLKHRLEPNCVHGRAPVAH